jgi:hypothetical protein
MDDDEWGFQDLNLTLRGSGLALLCIPGHQPYMCHGPSIRRFAPRYPMGKSPHVRFTGHETRGGYFHTCGPVPTQRPDQNPISHVLRMRESHHSRETPRPHSHSLTLLPVAIGFLLGNLDSIESSPHPGLKKVVTYTHLAARETESVGTSTIENFESTEAGLEL